MPSGYRGLCSVFWTKGRRGEATRQKGRLGGWTAIQMVTGEGFKQTVIIVCSLDHYEMWAHSVSFVPKLRRQARDGLSGNFGKLFLKLMIMKYNTGKSMWQLMTRGFYLFKISVNYYRLKIIFVLSSPLPPADYSFFSFLFLSLWCN